MTHPYILEHFIMRVPPFKPQMHAHACHELTYSVRGVINVDTPDAHHVLWPGHAAWIQGGVEHAFHNSRHADVVILYLNPDIEIALKEHLFSIVNITPLVHELIKACIESPADFSPDSPEERIHQVLFEQLTPNRKPQVHLREPTDPRGRLIAEHLRNNIASKEDLGTLAKLSATSERTIQRIFLRETGLSFSSWRHRLRLILSLSYLSEQASTAQAAYAVGYENPSTYISGFKRLFGCTPGSYFAKSKQNDG